MIVDSSSDNSQQAKSNILVTVRIRPLNSKEKQCLEPESDDNFPTAELTNSSQNNSYGRKIINVIDRNILVFDPLISNNKQTLRIPSHNNRRNKDIRYAFDHVFDENCTQQDVFENTTKFLIEDVLNGYNATVFAYGATGCGKTYTITGTTEDPGIIPRTMDELFKKIEEYKDDKIIESSLSYLEVYNETIRDLLAPDNKTLNPLSLREDTNGVIVSGLSEHHPNNVDDVIKLLIKGNNNRTKAATEANKVSSRSHAVLQLRIKQKEREANITTDYTSAVLSIIDLAGSERASVSKNQGERLVEGANINRSLLALGNCINALCTNSYHIPYRDSKLTRLLKFSLGGNCKVVMITNVSPSSLHYEETHNTLKYANRAKNIKTKIEQNLIHVESHIAQYPKIIQELRSEVDELKAKLRTYRRKSTMLIQDEESILQQRRVFENLLARIRKCYMGIQNKELECSLIITEMEKNSSQINFLQGLINSINHYSDLSKQQSNPLIQYTKPLSQGIEELNLLNETLKQKLQFKRRILDRYNAHIIDLQEGKLAKTLNLDQRRYLDQEIKLLGLSSMNSQLATKLTTLQVNMENELSTQQNIASQHLGHLFSIQTFIGSLESSVTVEEQEHIEEVLQGALSIFIDIAGRASINNVSESSTAYLYADEDEDEDDYILSDVSFCETDKIEDIALADTPSRRKSISLHSLRNKKNGSSSSSSSSGSGSGSGSDDNINNKTNEDNMEITYDNKNDSNNNSINKNNDLDHGNVRNDKNSGIKNDDVMQIMDDNVVYDEPTNTAEFYKEYTTKINFNDDTDISSNDRDNDDGGIHPMNVEKTTNDNDNNNGNTLIEINSNSNNNDNNNDNNNNNNNIEDKDVMIIQNDDNNNKGINNNNNSSTSSKSKIKTSKPVNIINSNLSTPKKLKSSIHSQPNSLKKKSNTTSPLAVRSNSSSPLTKTPQSKLLPQNSRKAASVPAKKRKSQFLLPISRTPTPKKSNLKSSIQSSPLSSKTPSYSPLSNKSPSLAVKRARNIELTTTPTQKRIKTTTGYSPSLTRSEPIKSKLQNKTIIPIKDSSSQQKERLLRRKSLIPLMNKASSTSQTQTSPENSKNKYLSRLSLGSPFYNKNFDNNTNPFLSQNNDNIVTNLEERNLFITQSPTRKSIRSQFSISNSKKIDDKYRRKSMFVFRSASSLNKD